MAYWDTEANGATPPLLGQIKGTPTIKAFVPSRKSVKNAKNVEEYQQAREVKDLVRFATSRMPNFVERVKTAQELEAAQAVPISRAPTLPLPLSLSTSTSHTHTHTRARAHTRAHTHTQTHTHTHTHAHKA